MNNRNQQRKMSRLQLKKLKEDASKMSDYKQKYDELYKDYATNLVERNSYLLETERLKDEIKELEAKVSELEHDLYYERRNKRISEMYSEKE